MQAILRRFFTALTMDGYGHGCVGDEATAIQRLPDLSAKALEERHDMGTDGENSLARHGARGEGRGTNQADSR